MMTPLPWFKATKPIQKELFGDCESLEWLVPEVLRGQPDRDKKGGE